MPNPIQRWLETRQMNPMRDFSQFEEPFDRLFNDFLNLRRMTGAQEIAFAPSCEITERGNQYLLQFDLPGVSKENLKVEVNGDQLTVTAERKEEKKQEDQKKYLSEVFYGSYSRSFSIPGLTDEKKIDAKFENGVLTLTVPKTDASKGRKIAIH